MTGFGSGAPRSATPYSVSMPTIFGTATGAVYRRTSRALRRPRLGSLTRYWPVVTRSI